MPGFQNPARPATLQHLLMNYASERLQAFFQHETFNKVLDLYEQVRSIFQFFSLTGTNVTGKSLMDDGP